MSGWAIPEEKADLIINELVKERDNFFQEKNKFLATYDDTLNDWIAKHAEWGNIIRESVVGSDYVRARLDFRWQMYKVSPLFEHKDMNAVLEAGLAEEVTNLGGTLFDEVSKSADEIWRKVYAGKVEVTHKALSPLKTLHAKLTGLSFVEPHVAPVADIIQTAITRIPPRGNITGADLFMLQGLVCLLRDTPELVLHAQKVIEGHQPASILDNLVPASEKAPWETSPDTVLPEIIPPAAAKPVIESMGLW